MTIDPFIAGVCAAIIAATPVTIALVNAIGKSPEHKAKLLRLIGVQVIFGLLVFSAGFAVATRFANNKTNLKADGNGKEAAQDEHQPVNVGHNNPAGIAPPYWHTPAIVFSSGIAFSELKGKDVQWTVVFQEIKLGSAFLLLTTGKYAGQNLFPCRQSNCRLACIDQ